MFKLPAGIPALLKEGTRHFQGHEEATLKNIDAAKKFGDILKTSYGPSGMSKLVNNFLNKKFLTSDAHTIGSELEVQHPAAKILATASQMQHTEFGDGVNFTVILGSELLANAASLMNMGINPPSIISGYELALNKALQVLDSHIVLTVSDIKDKNSLTKIIQPVLATKIKGIESATVSLIADACLAALPEDPRAFNTDNVRVTKLIGGTLDQSFLVNGLVLPREPKTRVKEKFNCQICVIGSALEAPGTESTSTVLIQKADDLLNFSKTEEAEMEQLIKGFHDAGVEALICGGSISPLALHYLDKYNMWAVATPSKFDIKRYCRTLRVPALQRVRPPTPEEIGVAEYAGIAEYGSQLVAVVRGKDSKLCNIVLRGSSSTLLEEVERAIDDAVSLVKAVTKDARFVPGAAAIEAEMGLQVQNYGMTLSGLESYSVEKFGSALLAFGSILAENAGQNALESAALLLSSHKSGDTNAGINVTKTSRNIIRDVTTELERAVDISENVKTGQKASILSEESMSAFPHLHFAVYDHYMTKKWAMKLAVDAALTILRVDQIIMSKPAGGPKMPDRGHWDAADERE